MFRSSSAIAVFLPFLVGCASTQVKRVDVAQVKDLSGRWNDTDARLTAEEMIADCLARPWLGRHKSSSGKEPTVIVGSVRNNSHEHINVDVFVEKLQRALINSNLVEFVANKTERGDVRDERLDQDANASDDTRKEHGQEAGADFMLSGAINTTLDKADNKAVMLYQVTLKLVDVKSNKIVWNNQKEIKKLITQSKVGW